MTTRAVSGWSEETNETLQGVFWKPHMGMYSVSAMEMTSTVWCFSPTTNPGSLATWTRCFEVEGRLRGKGQRPTEEHTEGTKSAGAGKKDPYRRKLKNYLQQHNVRCVWTVKKKITSFKAKGIQAEVNRNRTKVFFSRFSTGTLAAPTSSFSHTESHPPRPYSCLPLKPPQ